MNLSAVVLTKNSGKTLLKCLKSVTFADEIIVVDDYSSDSTIEIAKSVKAKVYKRELVDNFAVQRNFGLEKAQGEWVLFVDSDEEVPVSLKNEIIQAINSPFKHSQAFEMVRRDTFWGKEVRTTEAGKVRLVRLAKKGAGKWVRPVHEVWQIRGKVGCFSSVLSHYAHSSLTGFISSVNYFSTLHAQANFKEGKRASIIKIILFPIGKFLKNWLVLGGITEGARGFVISLIMSVHSFLAWSKLWIMQRK